MLGHRDVERVELLDHRSRAAALGHRRGPEREELPGDAAVAHPRQIDVAEQVRDLGHRPVVTLGEIVAELVHQLGGVGVEVEHRHLVVQRARLVERERHQATIRNSGGARIFRLRSGSGADSSQIRRSRGMVLAARTRNSGWGAAGTPAVQLGGR